MIELGPGQKPISMNHYPHFLQEDTDVWTTFLESSKFDIQEVWYDVRVGLGALLPEGRDEMTFKIAQALTRKRIDAVCRLHDGYWVVEVKPYANMYALGQVISYKRLFEREYAVSGAIIPVIVCDRIDQDLPEEFEELGVLVIENV